MNNYKLSMIFASIGIILISIFMIVSTYAYFSINVFGEGKKINLSTFDGNTDVVYTDTSNVSMVNAYTGEEITKTFTIKNKGDYDIYYDIRLENVVNNFENPDDLVYTIIEENNNGAYRKESIIPTSDETLASNIKIKKGMTHSYKMVITFLKTDMDQSNNMNKTFSSNINIVASSNVNVGEDLFAKDSLIKFIENNAISSINDVDLNDINNNGIYYTNNNINGALTYFYRGNKDLKNNVVLGNNCYKIIRTTENNGVRLIYSGIYENNVCNNSSVENNVFNSKSNSNAYVGFMYGTVSSSDYKLEHSNTSSSDIKTYLENWYKENLIDYKDYLDNNTIYCNNRKTKEFTYNRVLYGTLGYANNNTGYYEMNNNKISYECYNINDRLTVNSEYGSKVLNYPLAVITRNELISSGLDVFKENSFLNFNDSYWTLTPAYYNGNDAYNFIVNNSEIKEVKVSSEIGVRPVITLNKNVKVTSGDGSVEYPYLLSLGGK